METDSLFHIRPHQDSNVKVFKEGQVGEVYNVGGDNEMTNLAVVQLILQYLDKPESLITFVTGFFFIIACTAIFTESAGVPFTA